MAAQHASFGPYGARSSQSYQAAVAARHVSHGGALSGSLSPPPLPLPPPVPQGAPPLRPWLSPSGGGARSAPPPPAAATARRLQGIVAPAPRAEHVVHASSAVWGVAGASFHRVPLPPPPAGCELVEARFYEPDALGLSMARVARSTAARLVPELGGTYAVRSAPDSPYRSHAPPPTHTPLSPYLSGECGGLARCRLRWSSSTPRRMAPPPPRRRPACWRLATVSPSSTASPWTGCARPSPPPPPLSQRPPGWLPLASQCRPCVPWQPAPSHSTHSRAAWGGGELIPMIQSVET
jgi:hypothetical protein